MEKCKNCENLENGSIIKLDNDGNCPFCNRNISRFYPASDLNQTNKEIENYQKDIKSGYLGEEGDDVLVYTTNQTNNKCKCGGGGIYDVHLETCDQTNNRIREEFIKLRNKIPQGVEILSTPKLLKDEDIADWWLSKIDELLKSQREEMIEKIEKMAGINIENNDGTITCLILKEKVLSLIKEQ